MATTSEPPQPVTPAMAVAGDDPLKGAYALLQTALERLRESGREPARDSDVKRRILDLSPDFDETNLGFPKFSRFLSQAEEHGIVRLDRGEAGLDVSLADGAAAAVARAASGSSTAVETTERALVREPEPEPELPAPPSEPLVLDLRPEDAPDAGLRLGPRMGSTRRRGDDEPPPMFAGQTATTEHTAAAVAVVPSGSLEGLGLPSEPDAIVRYLTHRYKGVGEVTAQMLVEKYGSGLFTALRDDPGGVAGVIPAGRGEQLIEAWKADFERRTALRDGGAPANGGERQEGRRRGRGRSRGRSHD